MFSVFSTITATTTFNKNGSDEREGRSKHGIAADLALRYRHEIIAQQSADQDRIDTALVIDREYGRPDPQSLGSLNAQTNSGGIRTLPAPHSCRTVESVPSPPADKQREHSGEQAGKDCRDREHRSQYVAAGWRTHIRLLGNFVVTLRARGDFGPARYARTPLVLNKCSTVDEDLRYIESTGVCSRRLDIESDAAGFFTRGACTRRRTRRCAHTCIFNETTHQASHTRA